MPAAAIISRAANEPPASIDTLFLNAQVRYIDISTDATVKTTAGNVDFDVDIDPMVYMIGLGFKL